MKYEPALVRGAIGTVLALFVVLGWLTQTDSDAALAAFDAIAAAVLVLIPIVQAILTRRKVVPLERAEEWERVALFVGEPASGEDLTGDPTEVTTEEG